MFLINASIAALEGSAHAGSQKFELTKLLVASAPVNQIDVPSLPRPSDRTTFSVSVPNGPWQDLTLRQSLLVAVGDLLFRHPNVVEPWSLASRAVRSVSSSRPFQSLHGALSL